MVREHVAIVSAWAATALAQGVKRIETRFYRHRRAPYALIRAGDTVHFKLTGGFLVGSAHVVAVDQLSSLTPTRIDALRRRYGDVICAPPVYWSARRRCRYGVLIWLGTLGPSPSRLLVPRQYGGAWVVLRRKRPTSAPPVVHA
jgi:hypothetical protein